MRLIDVECFCADNPNFNSKVYVALSKAPTIDAVPVVRCKDCVAVTRWGSELVCSRIRDVMDGYYHGTVEVVKPDDYCSQGIRKSCAKMDGGAEDA